MVSPSSRSLLRLRYASRQKHLKWQTLIFTTMVAVLYVIYNPSVQANLGLAGWAGEDAASAVYVDVPSTGEVSPHATEKDPLQAFTGRKLMLSKPRCRNRTFSDNAGPNYPKDVFTQEQKKNGALVLHFLGIIYMFFALAIVCDEYFVSSLEGICERLNLSDDVAGATFMAAGGSAPELFTSIMGVFFAESDIGFGTIIGSAVFNVLFVIALCAWLAGSVLALDWWPLFRDSSYYCISIAVLVGIVQDGEVTWYESLILLFMYGGYIAVMWKNQSIQDFINKYIRKVEVDSTEIVVQTFQRTDDKGKHREPQPKRSNVVAPAPDDEQDAKEGENTETQGSVDEVQVFDATESEIKDAEGEGGEDATTPSGTADDAETKENQETEEKEEKKEEVKNEEINAESKSNGSRLSVVSHVSKASSMGMSMTTAAAQKEKDGGSRKSSYINPALVVRPGGSLLRGAASINRIHTIPAEKESESDAHARGSISRRVSVILTPAARHMIHRIEDAKEEKDHNDPNAANLIPHGSLGNLNLNDLSERTPSMSGSIAGSRRSLCSATNAAVGEGDIELVEVEVGGLEACEEEEGVEPDTPFMVPEDTKDKIMWLITWPLCFAFYISIPDCRREGKAHLYPLTFIFSILWIGTCTYFMVWLAIECGITIGIPDPVMGLTVLAAGTSIPDAISSVVVAKQGFGDMAVSSSIGSNVFDILVGLPVPWFIKTAMVSPGSIVKIISSGLVVSVITLFVMVFLVILSIHLNKWKLDKRLGYVMMVLYCIFIAESLLLEYDVFTGGCVP